MIHFETHLMNPYTIGKRFLWRRTFSNGTAIKAASCSAVIMLRFLF